MLKKIISYLLVLSFLVQIPLGVQASISSIDDENLRSLEGFFKGPVPAHSHFQAKSQATGAGVMVIAEQGGQLYTLLGKRDDTKTWCNFGGQTEDGQIYLSETAAQELMEESCGLYACPANSLQKNPSHTLQLKDITYRMYMRNFQYLDSTHFVEKSRQATDHSFREYTDFAWFKLNAIVSKNPLTADSLHPKDADRFQEIQEPLEIFDAFAAMLQESSVIATLSNWGQKKSVPHHTFRRWDAPNETSSDTRVSWAPVTGMKDKPMIASETAFVVPYGQNAAGQEAIDKTYHKGTETLTIPVRANAHIEREIFAHSVVKKARTLMELKTKHGPREEIVNTVPEAWQPLVEGFRQASPTERHLQWVLKDKFTPGRTKESYEANIRAYLDLLNSREDMQMTRDIIAVTDTIVNKLVTLIHQEVEALQHPTDPRFPLYHGADGNIGELYWIMSSLKEILQVSSPAVHILAKPSFTGTEMHPTFLNGVRGTDLYYKKFIEILKDPARQHLTTAQIIFKDLKGPDGTFAPKPHICTNPALTCGPSLGASTSNSVEYWIKAHSIHPPDTKKIFNEGLALLGINATFEVFDSVLRQYYGLSASDNGVILQMFVTPEFLENYTHAEKLWDTRSPVFQDPILKHHSAQHQYTDFLNLTDVSHDHYPEVWAYPTPNRSAGSINFLSYRFQDLNKEDLDALHRELANAWDHVVTSWLLSNTRLQEGAIYGGDPLLHKIHRIASRLQAAEIIKDTLPKDSLRHLINLNIPEGVATLLQESPESAETISIDERHSLLVHTLSSGNEEMARIIASMSLPTGKYASLLTKDDAYFVARNCLQELHKPQSLPILRELNSHFDFKTWDQSYDWPAYDAICQKENYPFLSEFMDMFGDSFIHKCISEMAKPYQNTHSLSLFLADNPSLIKHININAWFHKWVEERDFFNLRFDNDGRTAFMGALEILGVDWKHFYKNKPLIYYFLDLDPVIVDRIFKKHPELLQAVDSEGKTLDQLTAEQSTQKLKAQQKTQQYLTNPKFTDPVEDEDFQLIIKTLNENFDLDGHLLYPIYADPTFLEKVFPYLNSKALENCRFEYMGWWRPDQDTTKRNITILNNLPLETLHRLRWNNGCDHSVISEFLCEWGFTNEDREWVEKLAPALSWINPTTSQPYGLEVARRALNSDTFHLYADLIDLSWFTTVYPSTHISKYKEMMYEQDNLLPKLEVLLKQQGLI
ncbi:MAG: hypothetical protein WCG05_02635 [Alphaproteobacteria bacterium]